MKTITPKHQTADQLLWGAGIIFRSGLTRPFLLAFVAATVLFAGAQANAQCTEVISGLREPTRDGPDQSRESAGLRNWHDARRTAGASPLLIRRGNRRTLLDGLPSGISDVGEPSGPYPVSSCADAIFMLPSARAMSGRPGPLPGTTIPNPNPISSPIFSSILAIQFSAATEKTTTGVHAYARR